MHLRRAALASALVGLLSVSLVTLPSSSAAPRQDLNEVAQQVRELEMAAAAATEDAKRAKDRLQSVSLDLQAIQSRAARERAELRVMSSTIADMARAAYFSGGMEPTLQVLLADDPVEFLAQAAVMGQLEQAQVDQLRRAQTTRLRVAQTEAEITDREALAQQARDAEAAAQQDAQQQLDAAQTILAGLQEEERQRLAELAAKKRAAEVAAAAAAERDLQQATSSSSRPGSGGSSPSGSGGGSSGNDSSSSGGGYTGGSRAQAAVQYALSRVGDPYSYNARPPSSWDCSKLTAAAWGASGVGLTALSYAQWDQTRRVPVSEIQPGDLVFYFGSGAHHVAIYVGNGKMVSASNPSDGVELIDFLGPWYKERFSGVGRVVG